MAMNAQKYLEEFQKAKGPQEVGSLFATIKDVENEDRKSFMEFREKHGPNHAHAKKLSDESLLSVFAEGEDEASSEAHSYFKARHLPADTNRIFPLREEGHDNPQHLTHVPCRYPEGELAIVPTLSEFKHNFLDLFGEGLLRSLSWDNVVAAGGAIGGCLSPIPKGHSSNNQTKRRFYHDVAYAGSDIDLFLYGLDEEGGKQKLLEIYEAMNDVCPSQVVCFRSAHAVSIVSEYPFRHVQIILRLYSSPYEILAGFDVDSACCAFDGNRVLVTPRAHHALITQSNSVDLSRRSPSYEMRLAKYAKRGYEVVVPTLNRDRIDPNIYERPWGRLQGLGRLLVLEQLAGPSDRAKFNGGAGNLGFMGGNSDIADRLQERIEKAGGSAEESDYSTVFLPWGPGIKASNIARTMIMKDRKLNSSYFTRKRPYFLHPCFIGTAADILEDCSPDDPEIPADKLEEVAKNYVRGVLKWITDDPGRQQIGSFNPTTTGDWEEGAYFLDCTEKVCVASNQDDESALEGLFLPLKSKEMRVKMANQRDFFGRCPLHIAVMAGSTNAVKILLKFGARPEYRLPDGRNCLQLCAQYRTPIEVAKALFARGRELMEEEKGKEEGGEKGEEDESMGVEGGEEGEEGEEGEDSAKHKPFAMKEFSNSKGYGSQKQLSPLSFAILCNRPALARLLIENEASTCEKVNIPNTNVKASLLMLIRSNYDEFVEILIGSGTNPGSFTGLFVNIYHNCAFYGRNELLEAILKFEGVKNNSRLVKDLNTIARLADRSLCTPFLCAVKQGNLKAAKLLVGAGAKLVVEKKTCDVARTRATNFKQKKLDWQTRQGLNALKNVAPEHLTQVSPIWMLVLSFCSMACDSNPNRFGKLLQEPNSLDFLEKRDKKMEALNEVFGFREVLRELAHIPEKMPNCREFEKEKLEKKQKANRLLVEDRLAKTKEMISWLISLGAQINDKLAMKMMSNGGFRLNFLFKTQTMGDKNPLVTPFQMVSSAISQNQANHDHYVKGEKLRLDLIPSGPILPFEIEIDALKRLKQATNRQSPYEKRIIGEFLSSLEAAAQQREAQKGDEEAISEKMEEREEAHKWSSSLLEDLRVFLASKGGNGGAFDAYQQPQQKRARDDEEKEKDDKKETLDAAEDYLFKSYKMFGDNSVSEASKDIQEAAHKAFKLCFAGDLAGFRAHLEQNPNLPLNLVDVNQHTMAAVALLGEGKKDLRADLVKELLDRVEERYVDILKKKMEKDASDPNSKKIDNYKLFAKHGGDDDEDDEDDDDEDDEDDEDDDDDDDDDANMAADINEGKSTVSPACYLVRSFQLSFEVISALLKERGREMWAKYYETIANIEKEKALQTDRPVYPINRVVTTNVAGFAVLTGNHKALEVLFEIANRTQRPTDAGLLQFPLQSVPHQLAFDGKSPHYATLLDDVESLRILIKRAGGGFCWTGFAQSTKTKFTTIYENIEDEEMEETTGASKKDLKKILMNYSGLKTSLNFQQVQNYQQHMGMPTTLFECAVAYGGPKIIDYLHSEEPIRDFSTLISNKGTTSRSIQTFAESVSRSIQLEHKARLRSGEDCQELSLLMETLKTDHHLASLLVKMVCGGDVDKYNVTKMNLLYYAISAGQPESVKAILQRLSPEKRKEFLALPCNFQKNSQLLPLALAIQKNSPACFKELVASGADPCFSDGSPNCLQVAIQARNYDLARWVLSQTTPAQGAALILQKNREGLSALMMCIGASQANLTFMEELVDLLKGVVEGGKKKGEKMKEGLELLGKDGKGIFHQTYHARLVKTWGRLTSWAKEIEIATSSVLLLESYQGGSTLYDDVLDLHFESYDQYQFGINETRVKILESIKKEGSSSTSSSSSSSSSSSEPTVQESIMDLFARLQHGKKGSSAPLLIETSSGRFYAWFVLANTTRIVNIQEQNAFKTAQQTQKIGCGISAMDHSNVSYFVDGNPQAELPAGRRNILNLVVEGTREKIQLPKKKASPKPSSSSSSSSSSGDVVDCAVAIGTSPSFFFRDSVKDLIPESQKPTRVLADFDSVREYIAHRLKSHTEVHKPASISPIQAYLGAIRLPPDLFNLTSRVPEFSSFVRFQQANSYQHIMSNYRKKKGLGPAKKKTKFW